MKRLIALLPLLFILGCGSDLAPKAPAGLTPQVEAKFYATYVIKDLDVIRDVANDMANTVPPIISKATLLDVVNWHQPLVTVIHATPAGWQATALSGLDALEAKLSPTDKVKFHAYIEAARTFAKESK